MRWSRKVQTEKFLKRGKRISREVELLKEKEVFYLNKLSDAENAACSDAIDVSEYSAESDTSN